MKLKVGVVEYPPVVVAQNKRISGILIDYVEDLFASHEVEYYANTIGRNLIELENNNIDISLTVFKTPEREKKIKFSSIPLQNIFMGICGLEKYDLPIAKKLKIGHVQDTVILDELKHHTLVSLSSNRVQERMLTMLFQKKVDFVYIPNPKTFMNLALMKDKTVYCYEFVDKEMPIYMAYSPKMDLAVYQAIETRLIEKKKNNSFEKFLNEKLKIDTKNLFKVESEELRFIQKSD